MHFDNKVVVRTDIPTQQVASYIIVPNGWIDEDATWQGSIDLRADHIVLRRVPSAPRKGHITSPFRPMSIVATFAHLSYC